MALRHLVPMAAALAGASFASPAQAIDPISLQDSFPIGSKGNVACTAQVIPTDKALADMFDRGYSIVCRDASVPVGRIYALRMRGSDPALRLAALRADRATCQAGKPEPIEGLAAAETLACRMTNADVGYTVYSVRRGNTLYVAEGFSGYDSALKLALRILVADRPIEGEISVATTGAGDPVSFARVQAGSISPQRALAEAYRRNNSGNYAEAAEFFATLSGNENNVTRGEAIANEALQKSNLGSYTEAEILFARAAQLVRGDFVVARQLRNYRVMHLLNQGKVAEARAELAKPLPDDSSAGAAIKELVIDGATAAQLSSETPASRRLGASEGLSPQDKAAILDAQALQLKGSMLRLEGKSAEAEAALRQAQKDLTIVRSGRIAATLWMRAQILAELADIAEGSGRASEAEAHHQEAVKLLEASYPGSSALLSARGRLASFLARTGRTEAALAMFGQIVDLNAESGSASPALRRVLGSYFNLLLADGARPTAARDLFRASQVLIRTGVAQTQAVLARELSGGSDEAARLFRQSVNLTRESERLRVELARLQSTPGADAQRLETLKASLERAQQDQVATQGRLAAFPRYRVVLNSAIPMEDLQALLRADEAYYKMIVLGGNAYAVFVTSDTARAFRMAATPAQLERQVDALRATISAPAENGQLVTLPFDVEGARRLYESLFGPVAGEMAKVKHLVFEPDGAMLRLPPNLLVMDQASVETYQARAARPNDEGFDFRGVAWLGRDREISTAVSPRAFSDLRQAAPSRARAQYIGFGQNEPANAFFLPASGVRGGSAGSDCGWSLSAWGRPISGRELLAARQVLTRGSGAGAEVITGKAFSDDQIRKRDDLDQYRIVHFATHGLLAPPRPECPAQPALMTSFGGGDSDGLLSFSEIFDLQLDADIIILSACDTAGRASLAANREAGLTTGGDFALDGLVRAFVGAGGRVVVASHWPVPDDFDATQRLISGLFAAPPGTGTAAALRAAQLGLMNDANTSHPFYWSGFAVVGDGAAPVIRADPAQVALRD